MVAMPAQAVGEVRRPTFVRVVTAAGDPLANAVVTFAGCQPHLGSAAGPADVLLIQSDARGRAQAKLQASSCYVAWAVGPPDAEGHGVLSSVQGFFAAGALVELCCDLPYAPSHLQITGAEPWHALGPLQYFLLTQAPGSETALVVDADGTIPLPPGPPSVIEVRSHDGQPLWSTSGTSGELAIPPPQSLRVRVIDENGAPLAGASVRQRVVRLLPWRNDGLGGVVEDRYRELAQVDADGRAVVQVPYLRDPLKEQTHGDLLLFAGTAGRPPVAGGVFNRSLYQDDHKVDKATGDELRFTCKRVEPLAGCCGAVPAGTVAHLSAVCKLFSERTSYVHDARAFVTTVDAAGKFAFDDLPAELHSCRLTIVPPQGSPRVLPLFQAMSGRELPPEVAVREGGAGLALPGFTNLNVQVTEPGGGPARGVVAFLAPGDQRGVLFRDSLVRFPLDARGAASLRLAPGKWVVLAVSSAGWAASLLELEPGERDATLAMEPLGSMRIRLQDNEGHAIADARVQVRGTTTRGTGDALQSMLQSLRGPGRAQWANLRTDAEGRMTIPFVPVPGVTQRLLLQWVGGRTVEFALEAATDWTILRPQ